MKKRKAGVEKNKKVKKVKIIEERISSGISNFDRLIEGGFEKSSANLIVGGSGSGKTIFSMQFLMEGVRNGENVLYITFEEKKNEFFRNMLDFGWKLDDAEKSGKFSFLEYSPEKVRIMLEEGGGEVESIVLRKKITRIVIDSVTSFALLFEDDLKKREAALSLFSMLRKWGCTALLTYEEEPSRDNKLAPNTLGFESDSIIVIYFKRVGKERERYIEILKMRGTKHSREIYPLQIEKNGVSVGSNAFMKKFD